VSARKDLNALSLPALWEELSRGDLVRRSLEIARDEDLLDPDTSERCDVTSEASVEADATTRAHVRAREAGVLSGVAAWPLLLDVFGGGLVIEPKTSDGARLSEGDVVGEIIGPARAVLTIERTLLNLLGRMSGVATRTAQFVQAARSANDGVEVCETRKTTLGLRAFEKYAVRCGGGTLHRLGLYDAALIKDNHLAAMDASDLREAVAGAARRTRRLAPLRFVEVEVDTLKQLDAILRIEAGLVDLILLDNMNVKTLREAVRMRDQLRPPVRLEASGGVTLSTIGEIARAGVDRISVGALTHSAVALDFGLDFV